MSISFVFSSDKELGEESFDLGSASTWAAVGRWVPTLPSKFQAVYDLVNQGYYHDTQELAPQLDAALNDFSPPEEVAELLEAIRIEMGVGDPNESITIIS